ncbi:uncharacterized protein METZ01_LOCUS385954 [marine metagenome]|uniref:Uncharacterized protein n=1 Tax=marine metagenome TaxID=408172 RepID=A0A382UFT2_9ZZZZ
MGNQQLKTRPLIKNGIPIILFRYQQTQVLIQKNYYKAPT